jgi:hypothetical protein
VDGINTELTEGMTQLSGISITRCLLTVRPASSKPSICSNAILASSALLYLCENVAAYQMDQLSNENVLHEGISLASPSYGVLMKVDKLQFPERFENLLNVAFREVEVE